MLSRGSCFVVASVDSIGIRDEQKLALFVIRLFDRRSRRIAASILIISYRARDP